LTAEWTHWSGLFRFSLFQDDVKNTIFTQTDTTVIPNVMNFQNIGKVRSRGIELSAVGNVTRELSIVASYVYQDVKNVQANDASLNNWPVSVP
ncbi:TonB-dependent receptor, partial [Paraburkholderia sp. SIMBA_049]